MRLLISDANILIDVEIGGLVAPMFSLDYRFSVPDVLFYEELDEQHGYLIDMGLEVRELDDRMVARVFDLAGQYKRPGRYDLFALVLAAEENCPLLTGDKRPEGSGRKRTRRSARHPMASRGNGKSRKNIGTNCAQCLSANAGPWPEITVE
jgi:hypothetical protein